MRTQNPTSMTDQDGADSLKGRAVRGAAWSSLSTIVLRLGGLVVGIVLARLLTPEQFGIFAVALTVQGILMTVADLGLSADLIRSDDPRRIAPTVACLGLVSGAFLTVVTMLSSSLLAELLGSAEAGPAIAVLALTLLLAGGSVVPFAMLVRQFRQRDLFLVGVADFVVSTTVTLTLVFLGFGVMGLAIGRVAAQVASSTLQFVLAREIPRYRVDRSVVRPVLAFGLPIAAANLLSWALLNVDNIVLARIAGAAALGYYVLAFNISSWPMSALSQVVRSIALPYFSRARDDSRALVVVSSIAWAVALPAGLVLAVLSGPIIEVVYGARWLPAAPVLAALGLYGSLRVVFDLFGGYLYARGLSRPVLWIQIAWLVVLVGAMIPATAYLGIVGAGWVHVVVAAAVILPLYLAVLRRSELNLGGLFAACTVPTVGAVLAAGAAVVVQVFVDDALPALLLGGVASVAVYLLVGGRWLLARVRGVRRAGKEDAA